MLVDSHSHLAHPYLSSNLEEIILNAQSAGISKIITIGCSVKEATESLQIAERFENVYSTAGLYPRDTKGEADLSLDQKLEIIESIATNRKVVAIGECGLDFSPAHEEEIQNTIDEQYERFEKQILLAKKLHKSVVIHSRNASTETLDFLKKYSGSLSAVWHCFSESRDIANKALDLGLNISFTGNITYPKNIDLRETVKYVPLEKIMVETDSPYLIPQKGRNKKVKVNEPQYVRMIAEEIASIKGISLGEVAEKTTFNASKFYSF